MSRLQHHTPKYDNAVGGFGLAYHLEMVMDSTRVSICQQAIAATIRPESIFLELGCGTGIFSIQAAKICQRVYAIESDPDILAIARDNARRAGVAHKITFVEGDAMTAQLPERCDVAFCEMMSIWAINEPQVPVIERAKRDLLTQDATILPHQIINLVELGRMDYNYAGVEIKASITQFAGIQPPRIMSSSHLCHTIDFTTSNALQRTDQVPITMLTSGIVNCARLSSIVRFTDTIHFYSTDSLMPITIVPLQQPVTVEAGQVVRFEAAYTYRTNLDDSSFRLRV
ncbi:MAG: methyltransferase domain-containing protein [Bacteroidota bacterium]